VTSIHLAFDVMRRDLDVDGLSAAACPTCQGDMTLQQPDEASPDSGCGCKV